ncbi:restriction endonuclease subunit S [uncultured Nostoc sp.]|uniref:restriction endonuclease subunit S n=1 Tax=uncultured Nostoc sp. TaxID=340711 RepID=UPI0035C94736
MSEMQVPSHWKIVKLGDMVRESIRDGVHQTPTYVNYGIPFIKGKDIFNNKVSFANCSYISLEEHLKISKKVKPELEDILLTKVGTVGNVAIIETSNNFSIFVQVALIKPKLDEVNSRFLMYVLHSRCGQEEIASKTSQSTMRFIGTQKIATIKIPLPPLPEQKTIAHTLRTIQKAKETRQRELELERERKAALMQYLFTHGTGNEPRKQTNIGKIPETWEVVTLDKVCEFLQYGTSKLCDSDTSGIPVLRIPNVIGGKINIFDLKFTKPEKKEFEKLSLEAGDLLFVRTNGRKEYIGRCAVFCGKPPHAMFASYLIRVRLKLNTLLPEFFQFYTMTHRGKSYLSGRASNAADGKFNINTQTIKAVLAPIPSLDEQHEIIGTLKACDRKIQALEKEIALTDELFHAMLEQLMIGKISTQPLTETYV